MLRQIIPRLPDVFVRSLNKACISRIREHRITYHFISYIPESKKKHIYIYPTFRRPRLIDEAQKPLKDFRSHPTTSQTQHVYIYI